MRADTRVQSDTFYYSVTVKSLHLGIRVQLVEVAHAQRQIGVGEELHRLSLLHTHEQRGDVLLQCTLLQQLGKLVSLLLQILYVGYFLYRLVLLVEGFCTNDFGVAHNDSRRV